MEVAVEVDGRDRKLRLLLNGGALGPVASVKNM